MKTTLMALMAAACTALPAAAAPVVFSHTGAIQTWAVAVTGTYVITAVGAQGGSGSANFAGGRGASITGSFDLVAGQVFSYAVGGMGQGALGYSGGGGGGTFFVGAGDQPLLVAGGGGGIREDAAQNGCDASVTAFGVLGSGYFNHSSCTLKTDDLGVGGDVSEMSFGAAGAGFDGDGADDSGPHWQFGAGGKSWEHGVLGGVTTVGCSTGGTAHGGFGGGGSGQGCFGGGGGGGYSGGDGGWVAGGGGSWNTGYDQLTVAGAGTGNGWLSINLVAATTNTVPEPGSLALSGMALLGATATARRRRRG